MKRRRFTRRFIRKRIKRRAKLYRRTAPQSRKKSRVHGTAAVPTGFVLTSVPVDIPGVVLFDSITDPHVNCYLGVLYMRPFPYPSAISGDALTARDANQIYVSGFKLRRQFYTTITSVNPNLNFPLVINYCIVQPKSIGVRNGIQANLTANFNEVLTGRFFTDYSGSTDKDAPWDGNTTTLTAWRQRKVNCSLNSNNNFNIISHVRKVIHPIQAGGDNTAAGKGLNSYNCHWTFKKWMRYKKIITFTDAGDTLPDLPLYEMYWTEQLTPYLYPAGTSAPPTHVSTWCNHEIYYKNLG